MARAPHIAPPQPRSRSGWKRVTRRPWARPDDLELAAALLALIPSLPRPALAKLTTRMIDRMDCLDGNADVEANGDELDGSMGEDDFHHQNADWLGYPGVPEDAKDDDPSGDLLDEGEDEDWRPDGIFVDKPKYGIDQSSGPINEAEAYHRFKKAQLAAPAAPSRTTR